MKLTYVIPGLFVGLTLIIAMCIGIALATSPSFGQSTACIEDEWEQSTNGCEDLPQWEQIFCKETSQTA